MNNVAQASIFVIVVIIFDGLGINLSVVQHWRIQMGAKGLIQPKKYRKKERKKRRERNGPVSSLKFSLP